MESPFIEPRIPGTETEPVPKTPEEIQIASLHETYSIEEKELQNLSSGQRTLLEERLKSQVRRIAEEEATEILSQEKGFFKSFGKETRKIQLIKEKEKEATEKIDTASILSRVAEHAVEIIDGKPIIRYTEKIKSHITSDVLEKGELDIRLLSIDKAFDRYASIPYEKTLPNEKGEHTKEFIEAKKAKEDAERTFLELLNLEKNISKKDALALMYSIRKEVAVTQFVDAHPIYESFLQKTLKQSPAIVQGVAEWAQKNHWLSTAGAGFGIRAGLTAITQTAALGSWMVAPLAGATLGYFRESRKAKEALVAAGASYREGERTDVITVTKDLAVLERTKKALETALENEKNQTEKEILLTKITELGDRIRSAEATLHTLNPVEKALKERAPLMQEIDAETKRIERILAKIQEKQNDPSLYKELANRVALSQNRLENGVLIYESSPEGDHKKLQFIEALECAGFVLSHQNPAAREAFEATYNGAHLERLEQQRDAQYQKMYDEQKNYIQKTALKGAARGAVFGYLGGLVAEWIGETATPMPKNAQSFSEKIITTPTPKPEIEGASIDNTDNILRSQLAPVIDTANSSEEFVFPIQETKEESVEETLDKLLAAQKSITEPDATMANQENNRVDTITPLTITEDISTFFPENKFIATVHEDALIQKGEGVIHPIKRQLATALEKDPTLAKTLGQKEGELLSDFINRKSFLLAQEAGYITENGEVRLHADAIEKTGYTLSITPEGNASILETADGVITTPETISEYEYFAPKEETMSPASLSETTVFDIQEDTTNEEVIYPVENPTVDTITSNATENNTDIPVAGEKIISSEQIIGKGIFSNPEEKIGGPNGPTRRMLHDYLDDLDRAASRVLTHDEKIIDRYLTEQFGSVKILETGTASSTNIDIQVQRGVDSVTWKSVSREPAYKVLNTNPELFKKIHPLIETLSGPSKNVTPFLPGKEETFEQYITRIVLSAHKK